MDKCGSRKTCVCLCVLPLLVIIGLEATGRLSRCCSSASLHTELRNSAQQAGVVSDETTKVPKSAQIWKSIMEVSVSPLDSIQPEILKSNFNNETKEYGPSHLSHREH